MPGPLEGRLAEGFGAEIMHARGLAHRGINNAQDRREWKGAAKVENKSRVVRDGGAALQREVGSGAAEGGQHNSNTLVTLSLLRHPLMEGQGTTTQQVELNRDNGQERTALTT